MKNGHMHTASAINPIEVSPGLPSVNKTRLGNDYAETSSPTIKTHAERSKDTWSQVKRIRKKGEVLIDGTELDIASVIAVAKFHCDVYIMKTEALEKSMDDSVKLLGDYLAHGYSVYGVNTGFGGSADTRTSNLPALQSALLQLTQAGILSETDTNPHKAGFGEETVRSMSIPWVRASMLIRCNNAIRGHSGVRLVLLEAILQLLRCGITPIVPLRGSISASGDLMPLSYIAGVLEGNPDIMAHAHSGGKVKVVTACEALRIAGLEAFMLGPKEGLGLINGTATSAAVACFALHDSNKLLLLAQILVAMSCEALLGNSESYHPFIASVRPHQGQIECASNILRFLKDSKLATALEGQDRFKPGLFQDRYALRGTPQWLGPQIEDLVRVEDQLTIELNSTSDNPLVDVQTGGVYSGANFIASSVASGMEKNRLSLQLTGRLLFSLSSELINPSMNRGLPANLASDDPSLSFTMKGVDISMAAYLSELTFLANPVTPHVQSAESHNQQINSLALISARYTSQATTILAQMCAAHLYAVCQALDLRALHINFLRKLHAELLSTAQLMFPSFSKRHQQDLSSELSKSMDASWNCSTSLDLVDRCHALSESSLPVLVSYCQKHQLSLDTVALAQYQQRTFDLARSVFVLERQEFLEEPNTMSYLGNASRRMYSFVREELRVPFHEGLVEHPALKPIGKLRGRPKKTIGSWVSMIFASIVDDRVWEAIADVV
ncbi:unnamed protein product [Periconia digitata]|uniref:Phenylalanine ammonia-lyase n=1 Tax=Periconia digitata TaxID=1303443 RepID=A0A9W4UV93_9PLEO|nr:unnamed protein product [Periconia digitata]